MSIELAKRVKLLRKSDQCAPLVVGAFGVGLRVGACVGGWLDKTEGVLE